MHPPIRSPLTIPITVPTRIAKHNTRRHKIRFQNIGTANIYIKKYKHDSAVSTTNYQILLVTATTSEKNEAFVWVESTDEFYAVADTTGGVIAIYEEYLEG